MEYLFYSLHIYHNQPWKLLFWLTSSFFYQLTKNDRTRTRTRTIRPNSNSNSNCQDRTRTRTLRPNSKPNSNSKIELERSSSVRAYSEIVNLCLPFSKKLHLYTSTYYLSDWIVFIIIWGDDLTLLSMKITFKLIRWNSIREDWLMEWAVASTDEM
jgi:hypothetical protein